MQALGIAALVELEGQVQRLQAFMQTSSNMGIPPSSQMAIMREFARSFKLDPDKVLPTEAEIQKMKEAEAQQGPKMDPVMAKMELDKQRMQVDMQIHQEACAAAPRRDCCQPANHAVAHGAGDCGHRCKTNMTQQQAAGQVRV